VRFSPEISLRKGRAMFRKVTLALLVLLVVSQVSAAGPVRFALTPTVSGSSADGTLRIADGKPTDAVYRFHLSLTGLDPNPAYCLWVYGPDGWLWYLWFVTDENGSCRTSGTTKDPVLSATYVEIVDWTGFVVAYGWSR